MKCLWCGKKEADGIAVGTVTPIYCKECQLTLLNQYGMGTKFANQLVNELIKCDDNNGSQKRQINNADKRAKRR